jgi:hypothetical protein
LLKPPKQCLIDTTSFRLSKPHYSWFVPLRGTNNFGSVFEIVWMYNVQEQIPNTWYSIKWSLPVKHTFYYCT